MTAALMIAGLVLLVIGGEMLVRGASKLAVSIGISPLVVGLTVVSFGTSSPELAVSVQAALTGQVDIAMGNVVGSNIFNVLFILGLAALITPLVVSSQIIRQEGIVYNDREAGARGFEPSGDAAEEAARHYDMLDREKIQLESRM